MLVASTGFIPAIVGAMFQEVIDTVSILWGLRARYSHERIVKQVVTSLQLVFFI